MVMKGMQYELGVTKIVHIAFDSYVYDNLERTHVRVLRIEHGFGSGETPFFSIIQLCNHFVHLEQRNKLD